MRSDKASMMIVFSLAIACAYFALEYPDSATSRISDAGLCKIRGGNSGYIGHTYFDCSGKNLGTGDIPGYNCPDAPNPTGQSCIDCPFSSDWGWASDNSTYPINLVKQVTCTGQKFKGTCKQTSSGTGYCDSDPVAGQNCSNSFYQYLYEQKPSGQ